ncbi:MAG: hypothetical protein ACR2OB_12350 [Solirubrobacteraceae bacterium]
MTRLALAGALIAGALTVAPLAQADSLSSVRSHVHRADRALHKLAAGASSGSVSGPLADLEAQLKAAGRSSAKLYKHAHSPALRLRAATAITKVAAQENRDATMLTPLIGQLSGPSQTDVSSFIAAVTQARELALSVVTQLIGQLPTSAQGQVAGLVAQLSGAGTGQVGQLAGTISPGSIACPAIDAVSQVIASVLTAVQADLARVQSILAFLPAGAAAQVTGILDGLPTQLNSLVASIKQGFNCPSTTPVTSSGGIGSVVGSTIGVVGSVVNSIIQLVQSLLSSFLPGISAGQTPSPVTGSGPVSGLIGQAAPSAGFGSFFSSFFGGGSGGIPGFSSFFGGSTGGLPGLGG